MAGNLSGAYLASLSDPSAGLANRMAGFKEVLSKAGVDSFALARQGQDAMLTPGISSAVQGAATVGSEEVRRRAAMEGNLITLANNIYQADATARENRAARDAELRRRLLENLGGGFAELRSQTQQLPAAPSAMESSKATLQNFNDLVGGIYNNPLYRAYLSKTAAGLKGINQPGSSQGGVLE